MLLLFVALAVSYLVHEEVRTNVSSRKVHHLSPFRGIVYSVGPGYLPFTRCTIYVFDAKPDISVSSGQAMQTVAFMEFCVETQTLKGILTAIYLILTCEICQLVQARVKRIFLQKNTHV